MADPISRKRHKPNPRISEARTPSGLVRCNCTKHRGALIRREQAQRCGLQSDIAAKRATPYPLQQPALSPSIGLINPDTAETIKALQDFTEAHGFFVEHSVPPSTPPDLNNILDGIAAGPLDSGTNTLDIPLGSQFIDLQPGVLFDIGLDDDDDYAPVSDDTPDYISCAEVGSQQDDGSLFGDDDQDRDAPNNEVSSDEGTTQTTFPAQINNASRSLEPPVFDAPYRLAGHDLDTAKVVTSPIPRPTHLRFIEETAMQFHTTHGMPRPVVDSWLKSMQWAIGDDGVLQPRRQDDSNPLKSTGCEGPSRLNCSTTTLLKHHPLSTSSIRYAVCPVVSCQSLSRCSDLPTDTQTQCVDCGADLMVLKRRRCGGVVFVPKLVFTFHELISQLRALLSRPDILAAMREHRTHLRRPDRDPTVKEDIQHGEVWETLLGPDGGEFFSSTGQELGLILTCDWFHSSSMIGAASHSTGAIAVALANLPPHLRWLPENVMLIGTIPGPKEPDVNSIHNFLDLLVTELLVLWEVGFTLDTPADSESESEVWRAALVVCVCDTPAARKLHGTQGMTGTYPCTKCWCHKDELFDIRKVHDPRTSHEHRNAAKQYLNIQTPHLRDVFVKTRYSEEKPSGYRYSALLRLPYWDGARMMIIDPMHCLFLGIVKWQLQRVWTGFAHMREGKGLEFDELHQILESTELPEFLGRPPDKTGTKEGGSPTADQLRTLICVLFPIAIPVIWSKIDMSSIDQRVMEDYQRRKAEYAQALAVRKATKRSLGTAHAHLLNDTAPAPTAPRKPRRPKNARSNKGPKDMPEEPEDEEDREQVQRRFNDINATHTSFRLDDAESICYLSLAINNLTGRTVSDAQAQLGKEYLLRYLDDFAQKRGHENMAPNHHIATHIPEQCNDYGPLAQIWAYGSERLNRRLKNANKNQHKGGEMEESIGMAYLRRQESSLRLQKIAQDETDPLAPWAQIVMSASPSDFRGTVASSSSGTDTRFSRQSSPRTLSDLEHAGLFKYLCRTHRQSHFRLSVRSPGFGEILSRQVQAYSSIVVRGRPLRPCSQNGIIKARVLVGADYDIRVGDVLEIFTHTHSVNGSQVEEVFLRVQWYIGTAVGFAEPAAQLWMENAGPLGIRRHLFNQHLPKTDIIPLSDMIAPCARSTVTLGDHRLWVSIPIVC